MFTESPYKPPSPIGEMSSPCPLVFLRIRVVECYLHRGVSGISLRLSRDGHEDISAQTNEQGWAVFFFTGMKLTAEVKLVLTATMPDSGQYEPKSGSATHELTLKPGEHKEISLTLQPNWVTPPENFTEDVNNVLRKSDVRVWVDEGANFGNQAAAVDFLQEVNSLVVRAGYAETDRPLVRILSHEQEFGDYPHTLSALASNEEPAQLIAFLKKYLELVAPYPEDEHAAKVLHEVAKDGSSATLTLNRVCQAKTLQDGSVTDETSHEHLAEAAKLILAENCSTALGLVDLRIRSEVGPQTTAAEVPWPRLTLRVTSELSEEPAVTHILITLKDGAEVTTDLLREWVPLLIQQMFPALGSDPVITVSADCVEASVSIDSELEPYGPGSGWSVFGCISSSDNNSCGNAIDLHNATVHWLELGKEQRFNTNTALKPIKLELLTRAHEQLSVRGRLDVLAPDLTAIYGNARHVGTVGDFEPDKRDNIIGVVPALDVGLSEVLSSSTANQLRSFAGKLNARDVLILQPYLWHPKSRYLASDPDLDNLCLPKQASYVYGNPPRLSDDQVAELASGKVRPVIERLLARSDSGDIRFQVGYGLHQSEEPLTAGGNLAKTLVGMGAPKVVLLVPCKVRAFADGFGAVEHTAVVHLENLDVPLTALDAAIALESTKAILVTLEGALPGPLFKQLVLRSQLPVLFEGANTAGLLLNTGLPHLSVKLKTTQYASKPGEEDHVKALCELTALLDKENAEDADIERLQAFFTGARAGTSEVGAYFTAINEHCCAAQLDQLSLALYRLCQHRKGEDVPPDETGEPTDANALLT